ncbi:carbon catabolit repression protein [Streptomyces thermolineatus]|uniref:Carbon catabolit repression protein n=1 Tax=Streptomyces thermolineatus TaxID=44033 RepID=A0ABN3LV39_9ACTN
MSEAPEPRDEPFAGPRRPEPETDSDAWATACAEDLAREKARRAGPGSGTGSAAEELRRLAEAVAGKLGELGGPAFGAAAQSAAQNLIGQVKSAVGPVRERNPDVFEHLAAAGSELLSAYRAAVQRQEYRWTAGGAAGTAESDAGNGRPEGSGGSRGEHIDLD